MSCWDYGSRNTPEYTILTLEYRRESLDKINLEGPISSVSNWNTWVPPELKDRVPFRPMVRTEDQLIGDDWKNIQSSTQSIIHYFNEPERAGTSPDRAAEVWKNQMVALRAEKGVKLVSPACASDAGGEAWLAEFMKQVDKCLPDYLGLHYYGDEASRAIEYIESMHQKYPSLPVVVSEIGCTSRESATVFEFTAKLCNWMDETDWYVWFSYCFVPD